MTPYDAFIADAVRLSVVLVGATFGMGLLTVLYVHRHSMWLARVARVTVYGGLGVLIGLSVVQIIFVLMTCFAS